MPRFHNRDFTTTADGACAAQPTFVLCCCCYCFRFCCYCSTYSAGTASFAASASVAAFTLTYLAAASAASPASTAASTALLHRTDTSFLNARCTNLQGVPVVHAELVEPVARLCQGLHLCRETPFVQSAQTGILCLHLVPHRVLLFPASDRPTYKTCMTSKHTRNAISKW